MSEHTVRGRFKSMMVNLLIALINATLILVVAVLVLSIVAINKFENFTRVMAVAVARDIVEPVTVQVEEISTGIQTLNTELKNRAREGVEPSLLEGGRTLEVAEQLRDLKQRLGNLANVSDNLGQMITRRAIENAAATFAEAVLEKRQCEDTPTRPQHTRLQDPRTTPSPGTIPMPPDESTPASQDPAITPPLDDKTRDNPTPGGSDKSP